MTLACPTLPVSAVQADLPPLSVRSGSGADLPAGERPGGGFVPAGAELWCNLSGLGGVRGLPAQEQLDEAVQAAAAKVPGLKRNAVFARPRTPCDGGDLTS